MKQGIQTFMAEAGEAACYALCIIRIAEMSTRREFDPLVALQRGIDLGQIKYNPADANDNDNFFVERPDDYLGLLTGELWNVTKESADYKWGSGEFVVERWERVRPASTTGHFRLPSWDPLIGSQTVKFGKVASLRVFRGV
jgi:hypothetical protein